MPARQPEGPPPPPTVQRLRLRYTKRDRLRFTSHRDFARAFERAIRRAGLPMAYSAGFSPHPKISYLGAAPTGVASEAEYLEIGLAVRCDPEKVRADLDSSLPPGLDVVECVEASGDALAQRIEAALWLVEMTGAAEALAAFLAAESTPVERMTKNGRRTIDAREPVISGRAVPAGVELVVRIASPAVRPDDVLTAMRNLVGYEPPVPPRVTRLAQGLLQADGTLSDPLAPDREPLDELSATSS